MVFDEGLVMAVITQHLPGYIEGTPAVATFDSLASLLAVPFVAIWPTRDEAWGKQFYRFSISSDPDTRDLVLMAEFDKGAEWYVVGRVNVADAPLLTSLPRWIEPAVDVSDE